MSTLAPPHPTVIVRDRPVTTRLELPARDDTSADVRYDADQRRLMFGAESADGLDVGCVAHPLADFARHLGIPAAHLRTVADTLDGGPAPSWRRILGAVAWVLVVVALAAWATSVAGCAALQTSPTAQAIVYAAASPAETLAADALGDAIASIPADPSALHGWLVGAGLTADEADEVGADLLADAQAELSAVALYVDDGAFGRLTLSVLGGEKPKTVGPREAARYLLARARVAVPGPVAAPVTSGAAP